MGQRDPRRLEQLRTMALLGAAAIVLLGPLTGAGAIRDLRATSDGSDVVLSYRRGRPSSKHPRFYVRRLRGGKTWLREKELVGQVLAAAGGGGRLAFLFPQSYVIYKGAESSASGKWPLPWQPCAATATGEELWAVGVSDNRLAAARVVGDGDWVNAGSPLSVGVSRDHVCAVDGGDGRMLVMWLERRGETAVNAAIVGPTGWGARSRIRVGIPVLAIAAALHDGQPWLFYACKSKRNGGEVRYLRIELTTQGVPRASGPARSTPLTAGTGLAACARGDEVLAFCIRHRLTHYSRLAETGWTAPSLVPGGVGFADTITWIVSALAIAAAIVISKIAGATAPDSPDVPGPDGQAFAFAPLWSRGLAFIIDGVVCAVPLAFVAMLTMGPNVGSTSESLLTMAVSVHVVRTLYYCIFEAIGGQTLGKRMCGICVVRDDGGPVGMREAVIRNLLRIVDEQLLIGLIVVLTSVRYQRVGDLAGRTVVVRRVSPTEERT